jgi:hypothetical protein
MLTVDTIGRIRREYFVGKMPIREISRSLKVSRKVVRKAIRSPAVEFAYIRDRQVQPQLGSFVERLDQLLEENVKRSARERLTARRLHELLRDEGYAGAYDSVQRHVRDWRRSHGKTDAVFIPLWFAPGEAYQFDWSHETVVLDGTTTEIKAAHVRLCHSRRFFIRAYAERIVVRLDGELVADHPRRFGRDQVVYDPWHYVPVLARKPGALRNGAPFRDWQLPTALAQVRRRLSSHADGDRQFVGVLGAVLSDGLDVVEAACAEALDAKLFSRDVVLNLLARRRDPAPPANLPSIGPPLTIEPVADCARYDTLRTIGEINGAR